MFGFNGKILKIDLSSSSYSVEAPDENWYRIYAGGGLLGAYYLLKESAKGIDAFDPSNLLIFASSIVAGQDAPGLARFSVVTKSPLSQGIGETRCEGPWGRYLKGSGYDALVIRGAAPLPTYLYLEEGRVRFESANGIWGKDTNATTGYLEGRHGKDIQAAVIGVAGENLVRFASIVTARSIHAMRMGVGAVMGSKNLKAVALKGCSLPPVRDEIAIADLRTAFADDMKRNELSMWQKDPPGFSAWVDLSDDETAYLGVDNFDKNILPGRANYKREKFMDYYKGFIPCPGCCNDCIKCIGPKGASAETSGIHQEVTGALGPNIGLENLATMLEANVRCNLLGLDPVSLGFSMSFAMECFEKGVLTKDETDGLDLRFGNEAVVLPLIERIAAKEGLGGILAEGVKRAAEVIGDGAERFALHVKGLEMVSFDPRSMTNLGLGFATAAIGPRYDICEHDWDYDISAGWSHTLDRSRTLGVLDRIPMQYIGPDKVKNYKALNTIWSACDALDLCVFACAPTRVYTLEMMARLVGAITGWATSSYELMRWGERRNQLMRVYNLREGLRKEDDTLPEKFYSQPITEGRLWGTRVDRDRFQDAIRTYYSMMGWDSEGVPEEGTLYDYDLGWAADIAEEAKSGGARP